MVVPLVYVVLLKNWMIHSFFVILYDKLFLKVLFKLHSKQ